jgi:hypothetical protein
MSEREACPRPGLCLDLMGRLEVHQDAINRHEATLNTLNANCAQIKNEVHTLVSRAGERERASNSHSGQMLSIAVIVVLQLFATVWWGARLQATTENMALMVADHELRLREHAQYFGQR